jgi:hypothetical protein
MTLNREDAQRLLAELANKLHDADVAVTIHIVGGAAIMLTVRPDRTATVDVDSWINCGADDDTRAKVMGAAAEIARANPGISEDWLNENASRFIPDSVGGNPDRWIALIDVGNVLIVAARVDVLLAMKLLAGRGRRDLPDVDALVVACGLTTIAEVEQLFDRFYPYDEMSPRARTWLERNLTT